MFLGWREVYQTYDFEEQVRIRKALESNSIRYKIKTINSTSPSGFSPARRAYTGTVGEASSMYEYVIGVKGKDYELALDVIRGDENTK